MGISLSSIGNKSYLVFETEHFFWHQVESKGEFQHVHRLKACSVNYGNYVLVNVLHRLGSTGRRE